MEAAVDESFDEPVAPVSAAEQVSSSSYAIF